MRMPWRLVRRVALIVLGVALLVILGRSARTQTDTRVTSTTPGQPGVSLPPTVEIPLASLPLFPSGNETTNTGQAPTSAQSHPSGQSTDSTPVPLSSWITAMTTDPEGALWVSTEDRGVFRFSPSAGTNEPGTRYTVADGLGDDHVYAIAVDGFGRIYVGHLNHGVSIFSGGRWKNYDTAAGPLGERVFQIKVSPSDGDVWFATSRGLTRYSVSKDTWSYVTRADGLPSDQIQALAFDASGNIYVGTQCDGLAIAQAVDGYKTWRVVHGPDKLPLAPTGQGLPSSLINDVLVGNDGVIWVATTCGLGISKDNGFSWSFVRGRDWQDKVKGLYGGPPAGWKPIAGALLAEDYVTCLAKDAVSGLLWVGYRQQGCGVLDPATMRYAPMMGGVYATAILPLGAQYVLLGTYGDGLADPLANAGKSYSGVASSLTKPQPNDSALLPSPARPPTTDELQAMLLKVQATPESGVGAAFIGDDWITQGDWVGRYGRIQSTLCAMMPPFDLAAGYDAFCMPKARIGPNHSTGDVLRAWVEMPTTDDPRALYAPQAAIRRIASWDDHGEGNYPQSQDGPDIWISVGAPEGVYRISLYFLNDNGQVGRNRYRDYLIELKPPSKSLEAAAAQPTLARARVRDFWGGVYKQFVVTKPGMYWLRIARNNSFNTMCSAVLTDRLTGPSPSYEKLPTPWLGGLRCDPPDAGDGTGSAGNSEVTQVARASWAVLDGPCNECETSAFGGAHRLLAYRAALASGAPESLLKNWQWQLRLWTTSDRETFRQTMAQGWRKVQEQTPKLRLKEYAPFSPGTVDSLDQWNSAPAPAP